MNIKQMICLVLGIAAIATMWVYQGMYSKDFDPVFLTIVSVLVGMLVGGFVFTFKSGDSK